MSSPAHAYPQKRLDEVAEFLDATRRELPEAARRAGPYPYFGSHGQQGTTDAYLFDEPLVLLAEDLNGFIASGRPLAQAIEGKAWVGKRIHVLRPGAHLIPAFLACALERIDVARYASGTRRNRLTRSRAAAIRVPLPPLARQRGIAEALAHAERLREGRRYASAQFDAFVRTYFLERFGAAQSNLRRWPQLQLRALGENQDELRAVRERSMPDPGGERFPIYGPLGVVDWTHAPPFDGERLLVAEDGMNLVTRLNPVTQVVTGRFAVDRHMHVIAANGRADLQYLRYALELTELKPYLGSAARPKLKRAALERLSLPVPPLEQQRAFRALVEKAEALQALHQRSGERLEELYTSLRTQALSGASVIADR